MSTTRGAKSKCKICDSAGSTIRPGIECHICECFFHFDCASMSRGTLDFFVKQTKHKWACVLCYSSTSEGMVSFKATLDEMKTKLNTTLDAVKDEVSSHLSVIKQELDCKLETLENNTNAAIAALDVKLSSQIKALATENSSLRNQVNFYDAASRRSNLVISNVPVSAKNLNLVLSKIAEKIGFELNTCTIDRIFRIKGRNASSSGRPPAILVKFVSSSIRDGFFTKYFTHLKSNEAGSKLTARDLGLETDDRIYLNEHLAEPQRKLQEITRKLKKDNKILKFKTFGNSISLQVGEDDWKRVSTLEQLVKLGLYVPEEH
jgi:Skp family chaperone for outer membrane proteins